MWREVLMHHEARAQLFGAGVAPILTRYVLENGDGPFAVDGPFEAEGSFDLAHGLGPSGEIDRIYLNMWVDVFAPIDRTNMPKPANAGERAVAGRMFAEHVFTRLFAPPDQRKVTSLALPGLPSVPPVRYDAPAPKRLLELPDGATWLDDALVVDDAPIVFGLRHTDSNQHVDSLVYMVLFEEACVRRFAKLGRGTRWLGRELSIAYRKPCFAGQTMRVVLRTFSIGDRIGAVGGFVTEDEASTPEALARAVPHAFVRMTLGA